jgi:ribulose-phosphate 3-epimerase
MACDPNRGFAVTAPRIAPSILDCDFRRLDAQLQLIADAGCEMFHLDVMDGHFVPNLSIGVPIVQAVSDATDRFLDTHLMIDDPDRYAGAFAKAGSDNITFHVEASPNPADTIRRIRDLGCQVGVALNPATPADAVYGIVGDVDMILVMTVWPGFGGQTFIEECLPKIRELSERLRPDQRLEIDGGVNMQTVARAVQAGADTLVAGSAIYRTPDPAAAFRALHNAARAAVGV